MNHRAIRHVVGALVSAFILTQAALAQDPAPGLQDLVGARGSSGEQVLQERGYTYVKGEKSGGGSYTYWRKGRNGQCIVVHTAEGRYQSIVTAMDLSCQGSASDGVPAPGFDEHGSRFATVCGVTVGSKTYRYKCTVEGAAPGGPGKTVIHYPDQKITLQWQSAKRGKVIFEGMKPQPMTFNTSEGSTQFIYEGKPYFYVSDPGAAEWEIKHFKGQ